jgi:hypothetical protein
VSAHGASGSAEGGSGEATPRRADALPGPLARL